MPVGFVLSVNFRDRYKIACYMRCCQHSQALTEFAKLPSPCHHSYTVLQQLTPPSPCSSCSHHRAHICSPVTILHVRREAPLPDPTCQAELFGISCKITTSCIWWGRSRNVRKKIGCSEGDSDMSSSQVFCWRKQPNTEVSFLPHSLTQKKASQLSAFMCQRVGD